MTHTHRPQYVTRLSATRHMVHCECGASRLRIDGRYEGPWHTCVLCTHAWGLPSPSDTPVATEVAS
jgi:hypothetical protein